MAFIYAVQTGLEELNHNFAALSRAGQRAAAGSALMSAGTVLKNAIARAAPVGETGGLKRSIGRRIIRISGAISEVKAGVNVGKRVGRIVNAGQQKYAPHGHLVALGTKARYVKKTGKYVGRMPPNPFARLAAQQAIADARAALEMKLAAAIGREAEKDFRKSRPPAGI